MLNIDTNQKNKKVFSPDVQGNSTYGIWDLTRSSILIERGGLKFKELYIVKQDDEMRPDMIAYKKLADQGRVGSLMKVNNYSNPFSIDEGDIFYIPTEDSFDNIFNAKKNKNLQDSSGGDTNPNSDFRKSQQAKKFSPSSGRERYLGIVNGDIGSGKGLKNLTSNLPPNILENGERAVVTKSGLIFYGPDATSPNG